MAWSVFSVRPGGQLDQHLVRERVDDQQRPDLAVGVEEGGRRSPAPGASALTSLVSMPWRNASRSRPVTLTLPSAERSISAAPVAGGAVLGTRGHAMTQCRAWAHCCRACGACQLAGPGATRTQWPPCRPPHRPIPAARSRFQRRLLAWYAPPRRDLPWRRTGRPVSHPRLGDHAPADAGGPRRPQVPRVPRSLSDPRGPGRAPRSTTCGGSGTRSATTSGRSTCTASRARRWPATAAGSPTTGARSGGMRGIGRYTAGAHALPSPTGATPPIVDTNVRRVLGRVFLGPRRLARLRGPEGDVGSGGRARAAPARLRLQPGAHGLRRHLVHARGRPRCRPAP